MDADIWVSASDDCVLLNFADRLCFIFRAAVALEVEGIVQ